MYHTYSSISEHVHIIKEDIQKAEEYVKILEWYASFLKTYTNNFTNSYDGTCVNNLP